MIERLSVLLHRYIRLNNPDLFLQLEDEGKMQGYLETKIQSIDLPIESSPGSQVEELMMDRLTEDLKPSRFHYIKEILEEEFPDSHQEMGSNGLLVFEIINMVVHCRETLDRFGFSKENEDDRFIRYATIGQLAGYLEANK